MKPSGFRKIILLFGVLLVFHGCTYNLLFWERNIWQEFDGIFVIEEPDDLDLYTNLLPDKFSMPEIPMVGIFTADYFDTEHWPITPTKYLTPYLESALFITCEYEGTVGWYCPYMAVTTEAALIGGHRLGYPKILADSILFEKSGEGWIASTQFKNNEHIGLYFRTASLDSLPANSLMQKEFLLGSRVSDLTFTTLLLKPPAEGPEVSIFSCSPPPLVKRESGWVTIHLGGSLSGLVKSGTVSPGLYQHFSMGSQRNPSGPVIALILLGILIAGFVVLLTWFIRRWKKGKIRAAA